MTATTRVDKIFREKAARRRKQAALPFEEKIRILVRLQAIAREIKKDPSLPVWPIDPV
jgi:hypothetical protein